MKTNCCLILHDGSEFPGVGYGAPAPLASELRPGTADRKSAGEVVFNTGMTGYHEVLTDPSYTAQVVVMTYPHVGNYGCDDSWSEIGPEEAVVRAKIKCAGLVARSLYQGPVPAGRLPLDAFMEKHGTPLLVGIDTRRLTLHLREKGAQAGVLIRTEAKNPTQDEVALALAYLKAFPPMEGCDLTTEVGTEGPAVFNPTGAPHLVLVDSGIKMNIVREIVGRGAKVTVVSDSVSRDQLLSHKPDAVLYSSGPGDPAVLADQIALIKSLLGTLPVFGICLGHQLISQALGAKTYKMKFGHHGLNHPVRDELTGKVFVTTQNHGFAVDESSLPDDLGVWFRNANDGTIEGVYSKRLNAKCAQFHPEAAPGPHDSTWIFQSFLDAIPEGSRRRL
jgi:carbamoyl-phosphate synthase small subunit